MPFVVHESSLLIQQQHQQREYQQNDEDESASSQPLPPNAYAHRDWDHRLNRCCLKSYQKVFCW